MKMLSLRGFSLLEVIIAIAIFAIGMLALASLQGSLTRSSADANLRTTAANIAERTIEDLRAFGRIDADPSHTIPAYADIKTITATPDDPWPWQVVEVSDGGIDFTRTITVTPYYYVLADDNFSTEPPEGVAVPYSDFKLVQVNVAWGASADFQLNDTQSLTSDEMGTGEITLSAIVSSTTTQGSARVTTQEDDNAFDPLVNYSPGEAPDIIALTLGQDRGKFKESLLPEPDVTRDNELVETRFDVITYSQGNLFLRREEFAVVSCECTFDVMDDEAPGRRPVIWAGDEYVRGHQVPRAEKVIGKRANNQESPLCDSCCRDHHDGGSTTEDHASDASVNVYTPFNPEYIDNGDHQHYNRVRGTGQNREDTLLAVTTGTYVEACRLVRQDGFFRVAQDFRREDLNIFPADFFVGADPLVADTNEIATYSDYVTGAASAYADVAKSFGNSPNYTSSPPCIGPSGCVSVAPKQGAYPIAIADSELPTWTVLPFGNALAVEQQLRSRGVYIDYISQDLRTVLNCIDVTADEKLEEYCKSGDVELDQTKSFNPLELIPFFDVQLTKLNGWIEAPVDDPVHVDNDFIETDNTHDRGIIHQNGTGDSTITASSDRSNLAFTDTYPINEQYELTGSNLIVHAGTGASCSGLVQISGDLSHTIIGRPEPNIAVIGIPVDEVRCSYVTTSYVCEFCPGVNNPRVEISGYGKANTNRWACSTSASLAGDFLATVINGQNAKATFLLSGATGGSDYHFIVQGTACPSL